MFDEKFIVKKSKQHFITKYILDAIVDHMIIMKINKCVTHTFPLTPSALPRSGILGDAG